MNSEEKEVIVIITKLFKSIGTGNEPFFKAVNSLLDLYKKEKAKNERLTKDNLDLDRLYRNIATKLRENGKEELADYMLAQIGAVPTWTDFEDYTDWIHTDKIYSLIIDLQESDKDNYTLADVIMILRKLL